MVYIHFHKARDYFFSHLQAYWLHIDADAYCFLQVLHVMSFMIEVVGVGIQPHVAPLAQYLPSLWSESADHNMLRCAILTTLVHMVTGLMVSTR